MSIRHGYTLIELVVSLVVSVVLDIVKKIDAQTSIREY